MRRKFKLVALTTAMVMTAAAVMGCGSQSGDGGTAAPEEKNTENNVESSVESGSEESGEVDVFARYDEPVEISSVKNLGAGMQFPEGDSLEDNVWTRYYEEALNIKVNWVWSTNTEQYAQKVNIAITSDDIPDVMQVNASQLKMMYDNGQIMDVTEVAEANLAPFTKEVLNSDGGLAMQAATFDGRLYAIPKIGSPLMTAKVLWVRTDWLDNLGLELPDSRGHEKYR